MRLLTHTEATLRDPTDPTEHKTPRQLTPQDEDAIVGYVNASGVVRLPDHAIDELGLADGGGVVFFALDRRVVIVTNDDASQIVNGESHLWNVVESGYQLASAARADDEKNSEELQLFRIELCAALDWDWGDGGPPIEDIVEGVKRHIYRSRIHEEDEAAEEIPPYGPGPSDTGKASARLRAFADLLPVYDSLLHQLRREAQKLDGLPAIAVMTSEEVLERPWKCLWDAAFDDDMDNLSENLAELVAHYEEIENAALSECEDQDR